jgi:hypothetical protein
MTEVTLKDVGLPAPVNFTYRADFWFVYLTDTDRPDQASLTNSVDAVLSFLRTLDLIPGRVVLYRDSTGRWDQIVVDQDGGFDGFAPVGYMGADTAGAAQMFEEKVGRAKDIVAKALK